MGLSVFAMFWHTRRLYNARIMTTQCGAFRVCSVNFRARDARNEGLAQACPNYTQLTK